MLRLPVLIPRYRNTLILLMLTFLVCQNDMLLHCSFILSLNWVLLCNRVVVRLQGLHSV